MIHLFAPRRGAGAPFTVVVTARDDAGTVHEVHRRLVAACDSTRRSWEVVYVDDGSTDGTGEALETHATGDPRLRVVRLRRPFGTAAAISAGLDIVNGDEVVVIDASLETPPEEVPRLLGRLGDGFDVVAGRPRRGFPPPAEIVGRCLGSAVGLVVQSPRAPWALRREIAQEVRLYGEMHRFLPALLALRGARVTEIEVAHARRAQRPRAGGGSLRLLADLVVARLLFGGPRPAYLFFAAGLGALLAAVAAAVASSAWTTVLFVVSAAQFLLFGLLAEIALRTYHEAQGKPVYAVRTRPGTKT